MAKKNEKVDFGNYMQGVQNNHEELSRFSKEETQTIDKSRVEEDKRTTGKKTSIIGKKNGKTVYFDDETQSKFRSIKYLQNIDATNIIYTAVIDFLEKNFEEGRLTEKAIEKITRTCKP